MTDSFIPSSPSPLITDKDWIPFPDGQLKFSYAASSYSHPNDASYLAVQVGAELSLLGTSLNQEKVLALHPASGQQGWLPLWAVDIFAEDASLSLSLDSLGDLTSGAFASNGLGGVGIDPLLLDASQTPDSVLLSAPPGDGVLGPGGLWSPMTETSSPGMGMPSPAMSLASSDYTVTSNEFGTPSPVP
ncbi:hypothetical protein HK097_001275, partial [Rhizophlyctis rosea]